jgi:acetate kinase
VHILVINSGSSSIKFSLFEASQEGGSDAKLPWPGCLFDGEITGVGGAKLGFTFRDAEGRELSSGAPGANAQSAPNPMQLLEDAVCRPGMPAVDAVGYRVVHPWGAAGPAPADH